jgi:hypothetical protein
MSINEMIRKAGWFPGNERAWKALPEEERQNLAFAALGCEVAYATWTGPVDCRHIRCLVRRGEKQPIIETNWTLRAEMDNGYLRFHKDSQEGRDKLARLIRAFRKYAMEHGVYDPWKMPGGWASMVGYAIGV